MKAISLWEPWATLVVTGEKRIETRGWETSHRGLIAIHAAKRSPTAAMRMALEEPYLTALGRHGVHPGHHRQPELAFALGAIVGTVELVNCVATHSKAFGPNRDPLLRSAYGDELTPELAEQELAFGDYGEGRFAWVLRRPHRLHRPVPVKGKQRLWTLLPEQEAKVGEIAYSTVRPMLLPHADGPDAGDCSEWRLRNPEVAR